MSEKLYKITNEEYTKEALDKLLLESKEDIKNNFDRILAKTDADEYKYIQALLFMLLVDVSNFQLFRNMIERKIDDNEYFQSKYGLAQYLSEMSEYLELDVNSLKGDR